MSSIVGMTTIIYGAKRDDRISYISSLITDSKQENSTTSVDIIDVDKNSVGLGEIRTLIDKSNYTSLSSQKRYFIIYDAHKLTHQAQNALLKLYEEPHANSTYILELDSYESLLPTIVSRSVLHNISGMSSQTTVAQLIEKNEFPAIESLKKRTLPELFKLCEEYAKDKPTTKDFLFYLMLVVTDLIRVTSADTRKKGVAYLEFLIQSNEWISNTNVGTRVLLENCVMGLWNLLQ